MKVKPIAFALCLCLHFGIKAAQTTDGPLGQNLTFDPRMFKGAGISDQLIEQFNAHRDIPPGKYRLDVYLNEKLKFRRALELRAAAGGRQWVCIDNEFLSALGLELRAPKGESCAELPALFEGATEEVIGKSLQYRISLPQSLLPGQPRGHVDSAHLDPGITALGIGYLGNYQWVRTEGARATTSNSGYLSLNAGMNFGPWQFRQQGNVDYQSSRGLHYRNLRSYVQRPLIDWGSEVVFGQTFTSGQHLSSLSFTGVSLRTDERMLPDSMRGYAPTVRGIAQTNARVIIRQNGFQIYQTTVAPGSFEIRDLYPTSLAGDLEVEVIENDGTTRHFTVPFSAVPESLRPGATRYDISLGRTRGTMIGANFADATYSRGLSNALTGTLGLRVAQDYVAGVAGTVFNSPVGALGAEFTYMSTQVDDSSRLNGWMANLSYSRKIDLTNTVVTLAGYRYSTDGYRDLSDVIGARALGASQWSSPTYLQRDRYSINVNQPMGDYGALYLSASTGSYRDARDDDSQIQLGYSKTFKSGVSVSLSLTRQRVGFTQPGAIQLHGPQYGEGRESTALLSLTIPLQRVTTHRASNVAVAVSHSSRSGTLAQAAFSGSALDNDTLSYNLSASHATAGSKSTLSANAQRRFTDGTWGVSASRGSNHWQAGASAQGAAVVHAGGVTFGPYLGDTAALVEAPGAEGARIWGGVSGHVDKRGFVLVPSITPYRYNQVTLDPQGMVGDFDLLSSEQRVAPYAGALVKIKYDTRGGHALLIRATRPNGESIPMGAEVHASDGEIVSMVGQNNQFYFRSTDTQGALSIRWGEAEQDRCTLDYALSDHARAPHSGITRLEKICQ